MSFDGRLGAGTFRGRSLQRSTATENRASVISITVARSDWTSVRPAHATTKSALHAKTRTPSIVETIVVDSRGSLERHATAARGQIQGRLQSLTVTMPGSALDESAAARE